MPALRAVTGPKDPLFSNSAHSRQTKAARPPRWENGAMMAAVSATTKSSMKSMIQRRMGEFELWLSRWIFKGVWSPMESSEVRALSAG